MPSELQMPHKLTLDGRKTLIMSGVTEVLRFDDTAVAMRTALGDLSVYGQQLQLKDLSLEGGQLAVEGSITALIYEEPRRTGVLGRLLGR